ncbi:MAG: hypothetical protein ACOVRB_07530 [Akkermansiaceae bacterium]
MPQGYTATTRTYIWPDRKLKEVEEKNGHFLELKDMWAPIVIQMGRAVEYVSFENFQAAVKAARFEYQEGKLTYASLAKETFEVWANSQQLPRINGSALNQNPPMTYASSYHLDGSRQCQGGDHLSGSPGARATFPSRHRVP